MEKNAIGMTSIQYEELCRVAVAQLLALSLESIHSGRIPNPKRPTLPGYDHQVDLYWEVQDSLARYFNIANAKWRANDKVDQGEILLLAQVKQSVGAQKAMLFTSVGFTAGAEAAARDHGIGLHIVVPTINPAQLPTGPEACRDELQALSREPGSGVFTHIAIYKAFELAGPKATAHASASLALRWADVSSVGYNTKVVPKVVTKIVDPPPGPGSGGTGGRGGGFRGK